MKGSKLAAARGFVAMVAVLGLAVPSGAHGAVPKGDYACYGSAGIWIGTLKIKSKTRYVYAGKSGKYRNRGKGIKFKSGSLRKWKGGRLKDGDGDPWIKLVTKQAGGLTVNCYR